MSLVLAIGPLLSSLVEMGWSNVGSTPRSMDSTSAVMWVFCSVDPCMATVCNSVRRVLAV
jgi:hypothetical protein